MERKVQLIGRFGFNWLRACALLRDKRQEEEEQEQEEEETETGTETSKGKGNVVDIGL